MKDIKLKATFTNSQKVIEFELSMIVYMMGHQCAEDVSLAEEVGEDLAYLQDNWDSVILEVVATVTGY